MFRLSGDEFVLILSGEDKNSAAQRIAQAQKAIADQREQNGIFLRGLLQFQGCGGLSGGPLHGG